MNWRLAAAFLATISMTGSLAAADKKEEAAPSFDRKVAGLEKRPGFFPLYWDSKGGKLLMEIAEMGREFLYVDAVAGGLGSTDVGLDRGELGARLVARFERSGPRILLVAPPSDFRADSAEPEVRRAVEDSFASSALWGFDVLAEKDGRVLVDATPFFLRDAHDAAGALRRAGQSGYQLDVSRSALSLERTRNFPRNTEVEAVLTFAISEPSDAARRWAPDARAITVRQHFSLLQLPDADYKPRAFDPRGGFFDLEYRDYAAPLGRPLVRRLIWRHRLRKKDPRAASSEAVGPIVYYVDRGIPEPYRSAVLEGARWWSAAFEAAGYKDAFRVELLPAGVDPMDARYNVILWTDRAGRGWSIGDSVVDPRTGEIVRALVLMDGLRARWDYLIAEGLLSPYETDGAEPKELSEMALARLRQLTAHEVGHSLGLAHNFLASTEGRASVMDYPSPLARIGPDGRVDLSDAYAAGVGEWDKTAIAYGYQDFPAGTDEAAELSGILLRAAKKGLTFLSDQDSAPDSASPFAHAYDNGADPVAELERVLEVRRVALARFSEKAIRVGRPMSTLEETLVPLYLGHRYQTEAAAKVLGGMDYAYALRGDGQAVTTMVPPGRQRAALAALLKTLRPEALALPEGLLRLLPPPAMGFGRTVESFRGRTGNAFDPLSAAEAAAGPTVALLLDGPRAARLLEHHARDAKSPSLGEVIAALIGSTWKAPRAPGLRGEVQRVVEAAVLQRLVALASDPSVPPQAREIASWESERLKDWIASELRKPQEDGQRAHLDYALRQLRRWETDPKTAVLPAPAAPPPGAPIGD